ncbi:MAG: hypothetical protein IKO12_07610 [Bacteroidaceae bacterium]|nr:hypothetical protein [Bacteroidaceae bacterium]
MIINTKKKRVPAIVLVAVLLAIPGCTVAQSLSQHTIATIAKSDPLVISGAVGTQNTYRYSSVGNGYGSPLSNSVYANLNVSVYGITMPFGLYFNNNGLDWNYPHLSFHIDPTYKNWRGHFGRSSMNFNSYVMNMSFNGIGLEYNGDRFRAGVFYGQLRNAINDDPTDPLARMPQYKRMGWGFKAGYGSRRNYIDIYFLRAYDRPNSLDESWRQIVKPAENVVVGVRGSAAPTKWLSFTANAATSIFSTDTDAPKIETPEAKRFDKIFEPRYSSMMRFAGDANVNFTLPGFSTSISYRLVQPDYTSLGTYYMSNNYHSLGLNMNTFLFKKVSLSATFSGQSDNLTKQQMFTTRGFVYNANASTRLGKHFNINAGYNGYTQVQADGTARINDTIRVHRQMSSFTLSPSALFEGESLVHTASISANYTENKDKNRFATGESDVQTLALGANYNLNVKPWEVDFGLSFSHQESRGYNSKYISRIGSFSTGRSFLTEKNLYVSASASLVYNEVERQSKSLSIGGDVSASYTLKKYHVFSTQASFYKYGDVNMTKTRSNLDATDITVSLNYAYTFSLFTIKRKASKLDNPQTKAGKVFRKVIDNL